MSWLSRITSMFTTSSYDDEYDVEDFIDDEDEYERPENTSHRSTKSSKRLSDESEEELVKNSQSFSRPKVTPVRRDSNMEVALVRPRSFEDAKSISDCLLDGKAVVINVEDIDIALAQRVLDFSSGSTYSIDGKLQKISESIFIVTPATIDLSGDFQNLIQGGSSRPASTYGSMLR